MDPADKKLISSEKLRLGEPLRQGLSALQPKCYPIRVRTESTTAQANSHLYLQQHSQVTQIPRVLGMILAKGCLRDLHRTMVQRLGILIFTLQSGSPRSTEKGTPWFIAIA